MQLIIFAALAQLALGTPIEATGFSQSPGAVSGNVVGVPADIPVNAVGNSVNVIGVLNPTLGNSGLINATKLNNTKLLIFAALAQLAIRIPIDATGATKFSGLNSRNVTQTPASTPINLSGDTVSVIELLNSDFGNTSTNDSNAL